jgi:hypothetical protein
MIYLKCRFGLFKNINVELKMKAFEKLQNENARVKKVALKNFTK